MSETAFTPPTASMTLVERVARFLEPDIMAKTSAAWAWRQGQERKYAKRLLDEAGVADAIETAEKALERADAENMLLHLAVNDALHWLARGQVDRVETVLRDALAELRDNR